MPDLKKKVDRLSQRIDQQTEALNQTQQYRLIFGLTTIALFFCSQILKGFHLELVALLGTLPVYIFFFVKSRRERAYIEKLSRLRAFYQKQIHITFGYSVGTEDLNNFPNPDLVRDLDLQEVFPCLDYSLSKQGKAILMNWICNVDTGASITEKHQWLQEMAKYPGRLRRAQILFSKEKVDLDKINKTIQFPFVAKPLPWKWLILMLWFLAIGSALAGVFMVTKYAVIAYIVLTLYYLQETKGTFSLLQDLLIDLEVLSPVLTNIHDFSQPRLSFIKNLTTDEPLKTVRKFKNTVSLMSLHGNPILYYLVNFTVPWSFTVNELAERRRQNLASSFESWINDIVAFETIGSLATLYIYQTKTLPQKTERGGLQFTGLRHPLIGEDVAITNKFSQASGKNMFLITGSNMSGKSTFLRAVGINYCLAQMGAPVFAGEFHFPEASLETCIRVSDSLRDGRSYFYSEVQRLKTILTKARQEPTFILIDEPLRGTNNKERLAGNQAFLRQLCETETIGFLSTHDLDLTELEKSIPTLQNFHFTEVWMDGDLRFDYTLHSGPSQSTNALKIMEKEGLLPPP